MKYILEAPPSPFYNNMTSTTMTQRELKMTAEKEVNSLQTENNRLVELNQVLINLVGDYDDGDLIELYLERVGMKKEHHDAYRIFGKPHYLQYIKDRFERENTDMCYLNLFQVICRKWLVRRDLSPDIFEADTEEEEEVEEEEVEDPLEAKIDKMTVKQLKAFCKDNTIKNYTKLKKAELKLHIKKAMRDYKECIVGDYTTKKQHDEIGSYLSGLLSNIPNH